MDQLPRLPARQPPLPDESLASLVRRHAVAMGYERISRIRSLVGDRATLPPHLDHLEAGPGLESLAQLLGLAPEALQRLTVHRYAPQLVLTAADPPPAQVCDSRTILRFFRSAAPRFCPRCLADSVPRERLLWSFRPLPVCLDHSCRLLEHCPECSGRPALRRLDLRQCRCGFDLTAAAAEALPTGVRDFLSRIHGLLHDGCESPLPACSPSATFWWLERLAGAAAKTPAWLTDFCERFQLSRADADEDLGWLAAAEMACDWPGRFEQFLDRFQTVTKHRTSDTGISRSFGTLLRDAARLEELGCSTPADTLRRCLLSRFTRGHLNRKVCLFQQPKHRALVEQRPWISRTEAAKTLGLRHAAVADLVERGLLDGELHAAGRCGRSVGLISRDSIAALKRQLQSSLSVNEAALRLGIGRSRIFELIHTDLLPRAVRTASGWRIPAETVTEWERIARSLPIVATGPGWLTAREATRRYGRSGLTLSRLFKLLRREQVQCGRSSDCGDFSGLLVRQDDLEALRPRLQTWQNGQSGWPLNRLARQLVPGRPLKETVLRKWIGAGLLHARREGRIWRIDPAEVERFRRTCCLADEACRLLGVSRKTLSRWEREGRITPLYGRRTTSGAGASVFRREDIERLCRERSRQTESA